MVGIEFGNKTNTAAADHKTLIEMEQLDGMIVGHVAGEVELRHQRLNPRSLEGSCTVD